MQILTRCCGDPLTVKLIFERKQEKISRKSILFPVFAISAGGPHQYDLLLSHLLNEIRPRFLTCLSPIARWACIFPFRNLRLELHDVALESQFPLVSVSKTCSSIPQSQIILD